ncbi:hypothetical protein BC833DRAFT_586555 [Globomyces pollinis-pini]|nr:hypothetical protein BC833DRAFT_586555 [Globomyces pollinis-pini]
MLEGGLIKFVSRQVRDFCKSKLEQRKSYLDLRNTKQPATTGSQNSIPYARVYSVHNSAFALDQELSTDWSESNFDISDSDEELYTFENKGFCCIIEISGYTDLIHSLAMKDSVSSQIVARSIETYVSKVVDIVAEFGGDIIHFDGDSLVCLWRYKPSESNYINIKDEHSKEVRQMGALIAGCCIMVIDVLKTSEIWALEDISDEYDGFKLLPKCSIAFGSISEVHLGVKGFKLETITIGSAYHNAGILLKMANDGQILIASDVFQMSRNELQMLNFSTARFDLDVYEVLPSQGFDLKKLQDLQFNLSKNIILHGSDFSDSSVGLIESYLSDGALRLIRTLRSQKKGASLYNGTWSYRSFLIISLKLLIDTNNDTFNSKMYQKIFSMILKICRKHDCSLQQINVISNEQLQITCMHNIHTPELSGNLSLKIAFILMENLLKLKLFGTQTNVIVTNGMAYEGILLGNDRNEYRIISKALQKGKLLVDDLNVSGIVVDLDTIEKLSNSPYSTYFTQQRTFYTSNKQEQQTFYIIDLSRLQGISRRGTMTMSTSHTIASKENEARINAVIQDIENGSRKIILIEGLQGSGKTFLLNNNPTYNHPLLPFVSIVVNLLELLGDSFYHTNAVAGPKLGDNDSGNHTNIPEIIAPLESERLIKKGVTPFKMQRNSVFGLFKQKLIGNMNLKVSPIGEEWSSVLEEENVKQTAKLFAQTDDLFTKYRSLLNKLGENPDAILPLLNVFLSKTIEETEATSKIGPDGRTMLLSSFIVRLIDRVSEKHPFAILFDDVQWMASWTITLNIARRRKSALLVIASDPCAQTELDWRMALLNNLKSMSETEFIEIHGFSNADQDRIVKRSFSIWGQELDKSVLESYSTITEGRPEHIQALSHYLKENDQLTVANGKLTFKKGKKRFEELAPTNLFDLMVWQFDNVNSKEFQKLIKYASIVGRKFSLEEVASLMNSDPTEKVQLKSIRRLSNLIKVYDYYNFLEYQDFGTQDADHIPFKFNFSFCSSQFRNVVYNRIPKAELNILHLKLVKFYENQMTDENEPTFIPPICYHYQFTDVLDRDSILQHIQYMVMLGNYLTFVAESYKEVIVLYEQIKAIIEKHALEEVLGSHLMSEIHIKLGHAYSHGIPHEINRIQSLRNLMIAIDLLEFPWPLTESDWWALLFHEAIVWQWSNILKSLTGKRERRKKNKSILQNIIDFLSGKDSFSQNLKYDRLEHLQPILENMSSNLYETDARLRDQIGCDLLVLNNSFRMGKYHSAEPRLKIALALKFWFAGNRRIGKSLAYGIRENDLDAQTYSAGALFWTASGQWNKASVWADRGMVLCHETGEFNHWLQCSKQRSFIYVFNGELNKALQVEAARETESRFNGFNDGIRYAKAATLCIRLLQNCLEEETFNREELNECYRDISLPLRAKYQCIFAFLDHSEGKHEAALDCIERLVELLPRIHYSNNDVFISVLLGSLILYATYQKIKKNGNKKSERTRPSLMGGVSTLANRDGGNRISNMEKRASVASKMGTENSNAKKAHTPMVVRTQRNSQGEINFTYQAPKSVSKLGRRPSAMHPVGLMLLGMKHNTDSEHLLQRIKTISQNMHNSLLPFSGHALSDPFYVLLKALIKACDPISSPSITDGPMMLRNWLQAKLILDSKDMKLVSAIVAIKCWKLGNEALEYSAELNQGMKILAELGIEGLFVF